MAPVLVIGGAGYLGSHLVPMLIHQGHHPVVLDDLSQGHRQSVDLHPQATLVQGSFADRHLVAELLKARPIWLAAAVPLAEEAAVIAAHRAALRLSHRLLLILVPQDPADEPATELLARLRTAKQSAPLRKQRSSKTKP